MKDSVYKTICTSVIVFLITENNPSFPAVLSVPLILFTLIKLIIQIMYLIGLLFREGEGIGR